MEYKNLKNIIIERIKQKRFYMKKILSESKGHTLIALYGYAGQDIVIFLNILNEGKLNIDLDELENLVTKVYVSTFKEQGNLRNNNLKNLVKELEEKIDPIITQIYENIKTEKSTHLEQTSN